MRGDFRGCRYFVMFRPPSLLAPQIVPTAANTPAGQPGLLRPSRMRFVTSPRIGYANRPTTGNWRYGDLHPARLRPCRLLRWDRNTVRAVLGRELPIHAPFRYVQRVPNSTMTRVSASPPFHPGQSVFPSPVGDLDTQVLFPKGPS